MKRRAVFIILVEYDDCLGILTTADVEQALLEWPSVYFAEADFDSEEILALESTCCESPEDCGHNDIGAY